MNSTTFALLVFVGVVSMIAGYLLKYMQDIKHFKEIEEVYGELVEKMNIKLKESGQRELRLIKCLNELQLQKAGIKFQDIAKKLYNTKEATKEADESVKMFFDISQQLPDDNGIDFGGF